MIDIMSVQGVYKTFISGFRIIFFYLGAKSRLYPAEQQGSSADSHKSSCGDLGLLEVWKGCACYVPKSKRVSSVLSEWGFLQERMNQVTLVIVKKSKILPYFSKELKQSSKRYGILLTQAYRASGHPTLH